MKNKNSCISCDDIRFLQKELKLNKDLLSKYKFLYNWFVENFDYSGYGKNSAKVSVEAVFSHKYFYSRIWDIYELFHLEYRWILRHQLDIYKYWDTLPKDSKVKKIIQTQLDRMNLTDEVFKQDYELQRIREEYIEKSKAKYRGNCVDFSNQFMRVCRSAALPVMPCGARMKLISTLEDVGAHEFNVISNFDEDNLKERSQIVASAKFLDISFGVHAKEELNGLESGYNLRSPDDFFNKTLAQLESAANMYRRLYFDEDKKIEKFYYRFGV